MKRKNKIRSERHQPFSKNNATIRPKIINRANTIGPFTPIRVRSKTPPCNNLNPSITIPYEAKKNREKYKNNLTNSTLFTDIKKNKAGTKKENKKADILYAPYSL
ncbi:hypothetical protein D9M70_558090 [compost metagenome]